MVEPLLKLKNVQKLGFRGDLSAAMRERLKIMSQMSPEMQDSCNESWDTDDSGFWNDWSDHHWDHHSSDEDDDFEQNANRRNAKVKKIEYGLGFDSAEMVEDEMRDEDDGYVAAEAKEKEGGYAEDGLGNDNEGSGVDFAEGTAEKDDNTKEL